MMAASKIAPILRKIAPAKTSTKSMGDKYTESAIPFQFCFRFQPPLWHVKEVYNNITKRKLTIQH